MRDIRAVLWANVQTLMQKHWQEINLNRLARESGLSTSRAMQIKKSDSYIQLDTLERLATAFNVEPWILLVDREKHF